MTEVVPADRTKLLQSKWAECSAIARSRKRKLCVLYAVATSANGLPQRSFADPDAPPANPTESHFLEACDILQGKRLNELNIPARPRSRSEYPQLPRPSETFFPKENATKKKDPDTAGKSAVVPQPPIPSRPGFGLDRETGAISHISSAAPVLKQHQPTRPALSAERSVRPDLPASIIEQPQLKLPSGQRAENSPKIDKHAGTPQLPARFPTAPSNSQQHPVAQTLTNGQPRTGQKTADAQQQVVHNGKTMDVDVPPAKKPEVGVVAVQPFVQPDVACVVDIASSPSSTFRTATTPAIPDSSYNTSPDREEVSSAGNAEVKAVGMKEITALKQDLPNLTPPIAVVAGASESILDQDKVQPLAEPKLVTMKEPKNDIGETSAIISPAQPQKRPSPMVGVPLSESSNAADVDQRVSGASIYIPQPSQPSQPSRPASRDGSPSLPMTIARSDQQQPRPKPTSLGLLNISDGVDRSGSRSETIGKEGLLNSVAQIASPSRPQESQRSPTPSPTAMPMPAQPLQPHRRRTSSPTGVARQKPVAEILSEPPKQSREAESGHATMVTPTSVSSQQRPQSLVPKDRLKGIHKQSTVIFGRQPKRAMDSDKSLVQNRPKTGQMASDDYFTPLFVQAFTSNSKWMRPLDQILHQAHKTLSTTDSYTQILDNQACKVLKRVYHLQHHNKWSLRQPKRCPEPTRQPCHWDVLLKEMKWMRTDFREERKWKTAAARNLAYACAEWVSASPEDRKAMQVNAGIPPAVSAYAGRASMGEASHPDNPQNHETPDLILSANSDSPLELDDEPHNGIIDSIAPSAIFALESDDVVFSLHQSATADRLLDELPMYGSPLKVPKPDLTAPEYDPDATWRRPALPLSKYVEGRMDLTSTEPPRKRSRYRYAQEDDEDDEVVFGQHSGSQPRLEPQNPDVALFRPENKSIRDRLHAGHQFRPPNEHTMPFQSFYESRSPSQWIQSEDDELKSLVREYSYNWSLISSILSSKSILSSGAERRTPWECFERWVSLEGLPHDMQKTQYFKLWQGRIEASQQVIRQHQNAMQQQAQQQQQQAGSSGPITPVPKRRYNIPLKVERRRNQKHLTMIDAMRKLAKKRETAIQKQQHAASLAAMRKTNDPPQPRAPTKTPREYSIMRFERDQAIAERLAERMAQQQRHEAQRRAAMQRAQQGQVAQMAAVQSAGQPSQNNSQMAASHPQAGITRVSGPSQVSINGQPRARMPVHTTPNGTGTSNHLGGGLVPPVQMNGTSQVQMPTVNGHSRMAMPTTQPDIQLLMQAQQISEQQRRSVQMRQQQQQHHHQQHQQPQHQQHQQHQQQSSHQSPQGSIPLQSSPPTMRTPALSGLNQKNYFNNAQAQAMMPSFTPTNGSGMSTPPAPGLTIASQAGSPRPNATIPQPTHQQTYVSQLQHIESQIRQQHPNTPQDMVREMARQLLNRNHNSHNMAQSAMNAAAGGTGHAAAANGPHQYAQLLRAQQQQQAAAAAAAAQAQQAQAHQGAQQQHQRNSSGSATPTPTIPK
ncbi:hypothetical protein GGR54DRAFT_385848 [Hypoxylon sp. NC1633]|nr:hypothetical protein GGR54DRAFT_385848 [Hypoxylon sp. NC1633]